MASTYKAYLGEGLGPLKPYITKFKIPHPGRVGGYFAMNLTMPTVLGWVLGGNTSNLAGARSAFCRIDDQPRGFNQADFYTFLKDDDALIRASKASWLLLPATAKLQIHAGLFTTCATSHQTLPSSYFVALWLALRMTVQSCID